MDNMDPVTFADIDGAIADLMVDFGPDGHCDGHQLIALFTMMLLKGISVEEAEARVRVYERIHGSIRRPDPETLERLYQGAIRGVD